MCCLKLIDNSNGAPLVKRATSFAVTLLTAIVMAFTPLAAASAADLASPEGRWQSATGESRYEISYCGSGAQLCAKLVWLRSDARTPENLAVLNKYVMRGARPIAANKWRGTVHFDGQRVGGSVTMVSAKKLKLQGCKAVFCQSVVFHRI